VNYYPVALPVSFPSGQFSMMFLGSIYQVPSGNITLNLPLESREVSFIISETNRTLAIMICKNFHPTVSIPVRKTHHNKFACLGYMQIQERGYRVPCSQMAAVLPKRHYLELPLFCIIPFLVRYPTILSENADQKLSEMQVNPKQVGKSIH
jgi:hypothetical protein